MTELSVDFQDIIKKFGEPQTYGEPDSSYLQTLRKKIPKTLVDFWQLHGWNSMAKEQLWLPNPADFDDLMEVIFAGDAEVDHSKCHLVAYSAFGTLDIWSEQFQDISISLMRGWAFSSAMVDGEISDYPDNLVTSFAGALKSDQYDELDSNGKKLYSRV